jgi:hypothetical protein
MITKYLIEIPINKPNANGRIYTDELWKKLKEENLDLMKQNRLYGQTGISHNILELVKASFTVDDITITPELVILLIRPTSTEEGEKAKKMLESNEFTVRPTGFGEIDTNGKVYNYKLAYFSLIPKLEAS